MGKIRPGIYNIDYYTGAACAIYIGDIWVDDITSITYSLQQQRTPLYGYASRLWDDVAEGQVFIQGNFTINFKEAGYLWLVLNRYREKVRNESSIMDKKVRWSPIKGVNDSPFRGNLINRQNIEQIVNGERSVFEKNEALKGIAATAYPAAMRKNNRKSVSASLAGYASEKRRAAKSDKDSLGSAEGIFEYFENVVWGPPPEEGLDELDRRCDDPDLNPFDIYLTFGDFVGTDYDNHTIQRLRDVYIIGSGKQVSLDGQPIQEAYHFIARNIV